MRMHRSQRIGVVPGDALKLLRITLAPTLEHRVDQLILGAEAVLHATLGNARSFGDGVYRQCCSTLSIDDSFGHIQQYLAIDGSLSAHIHRFKLNTHVFMFCRNVSPSQLLGYRNRGTTR